MTWSDDDTTQLPAVQEQYARERVGYMLDALRNAGVKQVTVDWIADELYNVYAEGLVNETSVQLEQDVWGRVQWIVGQLASDRRLAAFEEVMMRVNSGDVWRWMQQWEGFQPAQVGENPDVANAWAPGGEFDPAPEPAPEPSSTAQAGYSEYGEDASSPEVVYDQPGADPQAGTPYQEYREDT